MRLLTHRTELRLVAAAARGVRLPLAEQVGQLARQAATARLTYSRRGDTDLQFLSPVGRRLVCSCRWDGWRGFWPSCGAFAAHPIFAC